jgi:hypothetical protein
MNEKAIIEPFVGMASLVCLVSGVVADGFGRAVTVKTFPSRITTYLPR